MDNVTHTLTGLMLSRAGLNRWSPYSSLALVLAANAPDSDSISLLGGQEAFFRYHRWITHAIVAAPFMALLTVLLIAGLHRTWLDWPWKPRYLSFLSEPMQVGRIFLLCILGIVSHLVLDWTNSYSIRLLLPFSSAWLSLDSTSVVDVWIWTAGAFAVLGPGLSRLVSSEIGARPASGRGWAAFFLLFVLVLDTGRYVLSRRSLAVQEGRLYNGLAPRRVLTFPTPANPFRWQGFVETDTAWVIQDVNLLQELDPAAGRFVYKPVGSAAIDAAGATPVFNRLLHFSKGVVWRVLPSAEAENLTIVTATDIRFGFAATAVLDGDDRVTRTFFHF